MPDRKIGGHDQRTLMFSKALEQAVDVPFQFDGALQALPVRRVEGHGAGSGACLELGKGNAAQLELQPGTRRLLAGLVERASVRI